MPYCIAGCFEGYFDILANKICVSPTLISYRNNYTWIDTIAKLKQVIDIYGAKLNEMPSAEVSLAFKTGIQYWIEDIQIS